MFFHQAIYVEMRGMPRINVPYPSKGGVALVLSGEITGKAARSAAVVVRLGVIGGPKGATDTQYQQVCKPPLNYYCYHHIGQFALNCINRPHFVLVRIASTPVLLPSFVVVPPVGT